MKIKELFIFSCVIVIVIKSSAQNSCIDSSVRMNYSIEAKSTYIAMTANDIGNSFIVMALLGNQSILTKTNSSDVILWNKKYTYQNSLFGYEIKVLESGNILYCGQFAEGIGTPTVPFIMYLTPTGVPIWFKKYRYRQTVNQFFDFKKMIVEGSNIYCATGSDNSNVPGGCIINIDLTTGAVKWSRTVSKYSLPSGEYYFSPNILIRNDKLYLIGDLNIFDQSNSNQITVVDKSNGNFLQSKKFVFTPFNDGYDLNNYLQVKSIGMLGNKICLLTQCLNYGTDISSFQITTLDTNLNILSKKHFVTTDDFGRLTGFSFVNNTLGLSALRGGSTFSEQVRDLVKIDSNLTPYFHRKFSLLNAAISRVADSYYFDHTASHHALDFKRTSTGEAFEYVRTGNFSTENTLGCFGKDTNSIKQTDFELSNEPFVWDSYTADRIEAIDEPITTDTTTVQQTLICKEVSICDSIKILGPTKLCVNQEARFTLYKNPLCKKYNEFIFDNTMMQVIRREADTAIVLKFTQPYRGKLNALLRDCVLKDSIDIEVTAPTLVKINPLAEKLCPGKPLPVSANSGLSTYTWSNGTTGITTNATQPGWLLVVGADNCGNLSKDSVFITAIDTSFAFNSNPAPICNYDSYTISIPNNVTALTWLPTSNTLRQQNELRFFPTATTLYTLQVTHAPTCTTVKTLNLTVKNCPSYIYFPNTFTPNGDGLNDNFKTKNAGNFLQYQLRVYNRYGQIVFSSNQPNLGWNGQIGNSPQPIGSYVWECSYQLAGANLVTKRGMVNLLR